MKSSKKFGGFIFLYYLCNVKQKQRTMTRKERKEYILNLDKVVKRWKRNSTLFCGGCCFSAGQIAKLLEAKNIRSGYLLAGTMFIGILFERNH